MENVTASVPVYGFSWKQSSILIIIVLISFRFTLGDTGILRDWDTKPFWLFPLSFIVIAVCSYCIACLVHPSQTDRSLSWQNSIDSSKILINFSVAISVGLWLIQWL